MGDLHGVDGPPRRALMLRALRTSVMLSILFVAAYGFTNWLTAQRPASQVGEWYVGWELSHVPYVPLLIVPYMTIDLFFFFAAFLCRDDRERRVLARRITFSILVAAAFFLLMPLRLAWPKRPRVEGWFGEFVERSCTAPFLMEYPHNLFPCLHVALGMILAEHYARHSRGLLRALLVAWFVLIIVSTEMTRQHHLADLAGGAILAGFAFHLFREKDARHPVSPNLRIGLYYAAGAAAVLAPVPLLGYWGVFLLWPAAALGLAAAAYFGLGPRAYRKEGGRLPLGTRFVLAPVLLGQYLSLLYYRRACRPFDEVARGVLIGRVLTDAEATEAVARGVTAVLDLTAEFSEVGPFRATRYLNLPVLDLTGPTRQQLREAVAFLARESSRGTVYVHCKIGYSRCAAVAGAYLLASFAADSVEEAIALLRKARPSIVIRPEALEALRLYAAEDVAAPEPVRRVEVPSGGALADRPAAPQN